MFHLITNHIIFRCNIPVVVMGETGCGKTRLVRFMCDLASQNGVMDDSLRKCRNMLIMKVNGKQTVNGTGDE